MGRCEATEAGFSASTRPVASGILRGALPDTSLAIRRTWSPVGQFGMHNENALGASVRRLGCFDALTNARLECDSLQKDQIH